MMPDLYVITCAPASRYAEALEAIVTTGVGFDKACIVTTQPDPIDYYEIPGSVLLFDSEEINISKWWDYGVQEIKAGRDLEGIDPEEPFDILIIESDARISAEDLDVVRTAMREHGCVMAGADWQGLLDRGQVKVRRDNSAWDVRGRIPGVAYVYAGECEAMQHNPEMRFWYADDWMEWIARTNGGTVLVGGTTVTHTGNVTNGGLTGVIAQYAAEDLVKFEQHWGGSPHNGGIVGL